ncbi:hypothetical protein KQX54_003015, partial [Cotesia glomerata]
HHQHLDQSADVSSAQNNAANKDNDDNIDNDDSESRHSIYSNNDSTISSSVSIGGPVTDL